VIEILNQVQDDGNYPSFRRSLNTESPEVGSVVIEILNQVQDDGNYPSFRRSLNTESPEVGSVVIEILNQVQDDEALRHSVTLPPVIR
jgi:uncharacterized protein (UPF0147 family)